MFASIKARFANKAARSMNKATMVATCHALGRVVYADGTVDDAELERAMTIFRNNPKLAAFGGDSNREFDRVLDAFKDSARMGRVAANRAIADFAAGASIEDKEDLLISCLDMGEADGTFDGDEKAVCEEIATMLGLKLSNYL